MAQRRKGAPRRAIVIHGIAHARAAAAAAQTAGKPVRLRSAPGAGAYAGAPWFREILAIVQREYPDADIDGSLDCADQPGTALAALRHGLKLIRFRGRGKPGKRSMRSPRPTARGSTTTAGRRWTWPMRTIRRRRAGRGSRGVEPGSVEGSINPD